MRKFSVNCEFASEIVLAIPHVNYLIENGEAVHVRTSKEMAPFYESIGAHVTEVFSGRTLDVAQSGLNDFPNNWIHHNPNFSNGRAGVLDFREWSPPKYRQLFQTKKWDKHKPYIVVCNQYNIEAGDPPARYFDILTLSHIFETALDLGYNVIYKRPKNTEFALDQNEEQTKRLGLWLGARVEINGETVFTDDFALLSLYDWVYNMDDFEYDNYNQHQLELFAGADGFVTINGGTGILCCYFDKPVVMYVPKGKEQRPGYFDEGTYLQRLSAGTVYPVFDTVENIEERGWHDHDAITQKMIEVFDDQS